MVDTADLKSAVPSRACGFESHPRHHLFDLDLLTAPRDVMRADVEEYLCGFHQGF
jgi:hypothetical protein